MMHPFVLKTKNTTLLILSLIGIFIFAIIIIPFSVNFIVSYHNPTNFEVAGDTATWVSFYGSFIGSTVSALVAFYVLEKTIITQYKENQKFRMHDRIYNEQLLLADLVSNIKVDDVLSFINPALRLEVNLSSEKVRLINLLNQATSLNYKFFLIYRDKQAHGLFTLFTFCLGGYRDLISNAIKATGLLSQRQFVGTIDWDNSNMVEYEKKFKELNEMRERCEGVFTVLLKNAQDYVDKLISLDKVSFSDIK